MLDIIEVQNNIQNIMAALEPKELTELDKLLCFSNPYEHYQNDPIGFCKNILHVEFTEDVRRIMLSIRDNPVTIAKSANATGKTHGAAHAAIWWKKCFPDSQVYTCAAPPEDNLKRILWGEIGKIVEKNKQLFENDSLSNLRIQSSASSFIVGVTIPSSGNDQQREAKFSGKHAPHSLFIVDEGDAVPDEVYRGIESCMSGGHFRLLIMFNPRNQSGPVYIKERDRKAAIIHLSALRHPNVITGQQIIPGAVDRETTVRRINEWSRPLIEGEKKDTECFDVPPFLVGSEAKSLNGTLYPPLQAGVRKITESAFSYMVLGEYPAQGENQLINRAWVDAARSRWDAYVAMHGENPPSGTRAKQGQDVAELGPDKNISCFRYGGFVARLHSWGGVDPLITAEKASALYKDLNAYEVFVDSTGVGASVAPAMNRVGCRATRVMVASSPTYATELGEFNILRDQLLWSLREWLRTDSGAMLPPDEKLIEELLVPTYSIRNGKIYVMSKDVMRALLKRSPDEMDALGLTFAPEQPRAFVMRADEPIKNNQADQGVKNDWNPFVSI